MIVTFLCYNITNYSLKILASKHIIIVKRKRLIINNDIYLSNKKQWYLYYTWIMSIYKKVEKHHFWIFFYHFQLSCGFYTSSRNFKVLNTISNFNMCIDAFISTHFSKRKIIFLCIHSWKNYKYTFSEIL